MGTLFRLLLRVLGIKVFSHPYLSEVSKTFESLPVPKNKRWFWGGLLHASPVIVALALLFTFRSAEVRHSQKEIVALLLASAWAWIGPVLNWYYEKFTLPQFAKGCRAIISHRENYQSVIRAVYSNIYTTRFCRYFTIIWCGMVILSFIFMHNFISGFGIRDYCDIFWWLVFIGTILISYYASLGFCFAHKACSLTMLVARAKLDQNIYHHDGIFGLSFIGDFAFKTTLMFFSGWLFAPLMLMSVKAQDFWGYVTSLQLLLLVIYFIFTITYFLIPIYVIHSKIVREKFVRTREFYSTVNELTGILGSTQCDDKMKRFEFSKKIIEEVRAMPNWPLRLDTALKFAMTSILIPTLAGALSAILKAHAGGP